MGKQWKQCWLYFSGLQNHCRWWLKPKMQRRLLLGRKLMTNLDSKLKSRDINLWKNVHLLKATVFPVVMYGCESWAIKKAECRRLMLLNSVVRADSWESLGLQGDATKHPKRDQSWVYIERTDVEPETPTLWPRDVKSWLIGKAPDAGHDWGQEE